MGNHNFKPHTTFTSKQPVQIVGSEFSKENVTEQIKSLGNGGYVLHSAKVQQSRPNAQSVYVTRVQFPKTKKYETFLSTDLRAINGRHN
jgi:hypothetical protein